jgi:hypothetical protein
MNAQERDEMGQLKECLQNLALQVARLGQAVEPLVRMQEEHGALRDRVAVLEGFRAAVIWLVGLTGAATVARFLAGAWMGK